MTLAIPAFLHEQTQMMEQISFVKARFVLQTRSTLLSRSDTDSNFELQKTKSELQYYIPLPKPGGGGWNPGGKAPGAFEKRADRH